MHCLSNLTSLSFRQFFSGSGFSGNIFSSMGGMGGMPGARRSTMDSTYDSDDHMFSGGMPGGMPRSRPTSGHRHSFGNGRPSSPSKASQSSEITKPLKVSLEDLYNGTMKHLKVGRKLADGTTEDKVLDVQVHPGWKSGTKIRFPRAGNEIASTGETQDLVFLLEEKPHEVFKREGNDLIANVKISLVEALAGPPTGVSKFTKTLEVLDGRKLQVPVPAGVVTPGQTTRIPGEGMPIRKDGMARSKGDLIVNWEVIFPSHLTAAQKEGVRKVLG